MRFLFWNLRGRRLEVTIARLVALHRIDVLVLAECEIPDADLQSEFRRAGVSGFRRLATRSNLNLHVRSGRSDPTLVVEGDRFTVLQLALNDGVPILFAAAHLPSKSHWAGESVSFECVALADAIRRAEDGVGHQRSVLVGDLNLNPYESGLIAAIALHSVPTRTLAARGSRQVQGVAYPLFYNPMWNFFGDETSGPPGTFFRPASEQVSEFWDMYDQVLVRPELLPRFDIAELKILTDDGLEAFHTDQGRPSIARASDHFPIVFRLN